MKADPALDKVQADAVWLVAMATERFLGEIGVAAYRGKSGGARKTMAYDDVRQASRVCRCFLTDISAADIQMAYGARTKL